MIEVKCKIEFDPKPLSGNSDSMFKPWWMIATIDGELTEYYAWFIKKRTGLLIQRPAWGAHISVIRGEKPIGEQEAWDSVKAKYQNSEVTMFYDPNIRTNGDHWWMRAHCNDFFDIREELNLPKFSSLSFHLTIGRPIPRHKEMSDYFHRCFKFYTPMTKSYMTQELALANLQLEPLNVKHKELKRIGDSPFRSECPECGIGLLLIKRDGITFNLQLDDNCTYCGRRFRYTDLKETLTIEYI